MISNLNSRIFKFAGIFSFLIVTQLYAQKTPVIKYLEIGTSANSYRGDLNSKFDKYNGSFHVGLKLNTRKKLSGHLNLSYGNITGNNIDYSFKTADGKLTTPNHFFKTSFFTFNYDLQFHVYKTKNWLFFVSQGFGFMRFTPKDAYGKTLVDNLESREKNEIYNQVVLMLPTQIGVMYQFENGYGLNFQMGWLNTQTDYLDNISIWGSRAKKDNVLSFRMAFVVPIVFKK